MSVAPPPGIQSLTTRAVARKIPLQRACKKIALTGLEPVSSMSTVPNDDGFDEQASDESPNVVPLADEAIEMNPNDADSGYGGSGGDSALSATLASSVLNYRYQNGRRYHAFRDGAYMLPNDDREQDRMDLHHHVFRMTLDGKLHCAPMTKAPARVLDVGTGTGIWAVEFADEYASSDVLGIDLSPIQSAWVPPNCKFYVDDAESEWSYKPEEAFDYIHVRGLGGSIADWGRFYDQIYEHLIPGGWCEVQEYEGWVYSDDETMERTGKATSHWLELLDEASITFGKQLNVAAKQKQWLIDAGFVDVHEDIYKTPIGPWAKNKKLKEIGMYQREQMLDCVEAFTLAPLTRILGWTAAETQILIANVQAEFRNPKNHFYTVFHFVYGRKPTDDT